MAHHGRCLARRRTAGLCAAALVSLTLLAAPASGDVACPVDWERRVVELVNEERARAGAGPLEIDVRLVAAARGHSEDMAEGRFLSHTGSDGSTPSRRMLDAGYPTPGGETAGAGQWSPEMIVAGWMNSPGHRSILLDGRYVHVGVGYAANPDLVASMWSHLWTANFGRSSEPAHSEERFCGPGVPPAICSDGLDNDGDGLVDHPADPGCLTSDQGSEDDTRCGLGLELPLLLPALMVWRARRRGGS